MSKILVTGGAGFIGSHLIDKLLEQNHEVICVDNFFSGERKNIERHLKNQNFKLINHDISKPFSQKINELDRIYNLACPGSPVHYQFDPVKTLNTSVVGIQQMLELARQTGARILQASTSEIYGDPKEHPQKETYWGNVNTMGERACYDEGKRAAETLVKDYHLQYGVDARIARIFNVYGPRMLFNDGRVISNFILQALLGDEITVHGDGTQTRSFCYIDDFIKGLMGLMESETDYQPYNLGNPDERSMNDLSIMIKEMTGSKSQIVHLPYVEVPGRQGDVMRRQADISKIQSLTGWRPQVDFRIGLRKTIENFQERLNNKPHILIFTPAYLPLAGPAEKAVAEIIKRLPGWEFDIITAKLKKNLSKEEHNGPVHIYRLGAGRTSDKYFLPLKAAKLAVKLNKKYNYHLAWAIMASYGAMAASIFSMIKGVPFLLSVYEGDITDKMMNRGVILSPIYKLIFSRAHRWQLIAKMSEQQRTWLENERHVQVVKFDEDWELLAKRTKEMFQELEILSTRIK